MIDSSLFTLVIAPANVESRNNLYFWFSASFESGIVSVTSESSFDLDIFSIAEPERTR